MVRTFVAVEIGQDVRARAATLIRQLRNSGAKVKWVDPGSMHFTMKFLGEVDVREVPAICKAVSQSVAGISPFEIEVRGAGAFPTVHRPRTVWVGVGQGSEGMVALHDAVEGGLAELGFRTEGRRFRPHLTIGRVRASPTGIPELGKLIEQNADFEAGESIVEDVVVFSSELAPHGPVYEVLGHAELGS